MARLYANENFPLDAVKVLRNLGHDVLTVREAGNAGQAISDEEVLLFATQHERAVVTLNRRDFIRLHRFQPTHSDIIVCTSDVDTHGQALRIHDAIARSATLVGALIRVNRPER